MFAQAICVVALLAASPPPVPSTDQDLKSLQGRWERAIAPDDAGENKHGGAAKAVKEIKGNAETVRYVNDAGDVVYATSADLKLEQSGRAKLYTFSNFKVTQGKWAGGDPPKGAVSYIYRVDGDVYHEAHGLLVDSPAGAKPAVVTWKRMK